MRTRTLLGLTAIAMLGCLPFHAPTAGVPVKSFEPDHPKVIVLLHGATDKPELHPEKDIGRLKHPRNYWGFPFVLALLGGNQELTTFSDARLTAQTWESEALRDSEPGDHFVMPPSESGRKVPNLSAMLTHRNGSQSLGAQAKAAVNQIYDLYAARFGTGDAAPDIILMGHSMGGNVARFIVSNPSETVAGVGLTAAERSKADFIRNRTLYVVTIATPHEGSPDADKYNLLSDYFTAAPPTVRAFYKATGIDSPRDYVAGWLGANSDSTEHLKTRFWEQINTSLLAPHRAARADGSLIPIYCLGARSPGREFFDDPSANPLEIAQFLAKQKPRTLYETVGLMTLDYGLHMTPGQPDSWGAPPGDSRDLDWVRRAFLTTLPPGELSRTRERPEMFPVYYLKYPFRREGGLLGILPKYVPESDEQNSDSSYVRKTSDGEIDSDGMVGIDSALGITLGTRTIEYFDHSRDWTIDGKRHPGSWYRLYSGPWNWDHHGSIHRATAGGKWLHANIIAAAGPYVGPRSLSVWFQ